MEMEKREVDEQVVIVGAGISGLATALALHRKGIKSVVLERSETLRSTTGAAITIRANGWRALDQLGVANTLRQTSFPIQGERLILLDKDKEQRKPVVGEARCLKRSDLINTLYKALPPSTVQFGQQTVSVALDPQTNYPTLQLHDGRSMVMKVLIGCDGANSVVANYLNLKPTKLSGLCGLRGIANYPDGHSFGNDFFRMKKNQILVGIIPINVNFVYWFVSVRRTSVEEKYSGEPEQIRQITLESVKDFPAEIKEMITCSDLNSLSLSLLRYRTPWDLWRGKLTKETVALAGDAMHVMGPFLAQGGSAGLEDAVVLARCLANKLSSINLAEIGDALDQYVKERRMRVVRLSTQTYLTGLFLETSSPLMKFICILLFLVLFRDQSGHINYDCGSL